MTAERNKDSAKHGHAKTYEQTPTYRSWLQMHARCKYKKGYADRGIKVCERWSSFENFLEDMGERPTNKTLDRKNTYGDYCPKN